MEKLWLLSPAGLAPPSFDTLTLALGRRWWNWQVGELCLTSTPRYNREARVPRDGGGLESRSGLRQVPLAIGRGMKTRCSWAHGGKQPQKAPKRSWSLGSSRPRHQPAGRSRWGIPNLGTARWLLLHSDSRRISTSISPQQVCRPTACLSHSYARLQVTCLISHWGQWLPELRQSFRTLPLRHRFPPRHRSWLSQFQWGRKYSPPMEIGRCKTLINDECDLTDQRLYTFS